MKWHGPGRTVKIQKLTDEQRARYIDRVGFELEGYWEGNEPDGFHEDGSVSESLMGERSSCIDGDDDYNDEDGEGPPSDRDSGWLGESTSRPLRIGHGTWRTWLERNWPHNWDRSCGFHIHTSFHDAGAYQWLAEPAFHDNVFIPTMTAKAGVWGPRFNDRLRGGNTYCRRTFIPMEQVWGNENRYTQLNFCALREHNTIECRLFPMFQSLHGGTRTETGRFGPSRSHLDLAVDAAETLFDTYVTYLHQCERARLKTVRKLKQTNELIAADTIGIPAQSRKNKKPEVILCVL